MAASPLPNLSGKGVERGHMMCLPHHPPILIVVGPGIFGPDAKAIKPRLAQHLSGPREVQHDACADARDARQNKKSAHDTAHLTTVLENFKR